MWPGRPPSCSPREPSATVAEAKAALLDTGGPVAGLSGKTVTGRRLNLDAALTSAAIRQDTTTNMTSDGPDPSVVGQPVTVQYSVAVDAPGSRHPDRERDGQRRHQLHGTVAAGL